MKKNIMEEGHSMEEEFSRGNKENKWKKNAVIFLLGIIGLVGAYVLARGLSGMQYLGQRAAAGEEVLLEDASLEPAKEALTEDEITDLLAGMKTDTQTPEEDPNVSDERPEEEEIPFPGKDTAEVSVIDFEALWEVNEDVYAWITIPGTVIDYPILQHPTDNSRYLNYNIDGSYGYPGCIYTENMNSKDFTDPNTVIYGHNMKNGTMFAGLHQFKSKDFFEEHKEIIIYLPEDTLHYEIFAVYVYDDRHLMYSFDFFNPDVFAAFLKSIFDIRDMNANINKEVEVTEQDKILTLTTCISNQQDKRLLVHAVLMEGTGE